MARVWLEKTLTGVKGHDEEARRVLNRFPVATVFEADVITRQARSVAWNKRYWKLMSMLAENIAEVDIGDGVVLPIHDKEDMHLALKFLTGHCDTYVTEVERRVHKVRIPKPTNFDDLDAEGWADYWRKSLDAIHLHILPNIESYVEQEELGRMAS